MEIVLRDDRIHYETGQTVSGVVRIDTDGVPLILNELSIELIGGSEVEWTHSLFGADENVTMDNPVFHRTKKYVHLVYELTDKDVEKVTKKTTSLKEIPFSFQLPEKDIPSSFESVCGKIMYRVFATYKFDDEESCIGHPIQVLAPLKGKFNISVASTVTKQFGVLSLHSGSITLHASLPRKGYTPGEKIEIQCDVFNDSSSEATPRATLYQTQVYLFGEKYKSFQIPLLEQVVGQSVPKSTNTMEFLTFTLPKTIPLTIKSDLISVKYFIHVTLDIPHAFDIHVNLPFVVTTRSALKEQL